MEGLAAASSIFAVVSVAFQLGSTVQQLISFWESVKEAPAEVAQIKSQLRVLGALLRGIEVDSQQPSSPSTPDIAHDCLSVCYSSISKLQELSQELDKGLNGNGIRRNWTKLRKAMREKELAAYWSELERAKSMLIMYQCLRNGYAHDKF